MPNQVLIDIELLVLVVGRAGNGNPAETFTPSSDGASRWASSKRMNIPTGRSARTSSMDCGVVRNGGMIIISIGNENMFTLGADQAGMAIDSGRFQVLGTQRGVTEGADNTDHGETP